MQEITKILLQFHRGVYLNKRVSSTTFANNANVEIAERMLLFEKTIEKNSASE